MGTKNTLYMSQSCIQNCVCGLMSWSFSFDSCFYSACCIGFFLLLRIFNPFNLKSTLRIQIIVHAYLFVFRESSSWVYGKKYTIWVEKSIWWLSGIKYTVVGGKKYTICDSSGKKYTILMEKQARSSGLIQPP